MPRKSIPDASGPRRLNQAQFASGSRQKASERHRRDDLALLPISRSLAPEDSAPSMCMTAVSKGRQWAASQTGGQAEFDITASKDGAVGFGGLMNCDSVWLCPRCGSRISRQDRQNVSRVTCEHMSAGWGVVMGMGSVPHGRRNTLQEVQDDRLRPVLKRTLARLGREFPGRRYVRAIEHLVDITGHGHGWHPHVHLLIFVPPGIPVAQVCQRWQEIWIEEAARDGIVVDPRAIGAQGAATPAAAAQYVTKGAEYRAVNEVVMGQTTKEGNDDLVTPFQLLELIYELRQKKKRAANQQLSHTDYRRLVRFENLYREYAAAVHGQIRRIQASRGIKLNIDEKTGGEQQSERCQDAIAHVRAEALPKIHRHFADIRNAIVLAPRESWYQAAWNALVDLGVRPDWIRPGIAAYPDDLPAGFGAGAPPRPGEAVWMAAHRAANDQDVPNGTPERAAFVRAYLHRHERSHPPRAA